LAYSLPEEVDQRPVTIVGAGTLGRRIATVFAAGGSDVRVFDTSSEQLEAGRDHVEQHAAEVQEALDLRPGDILAPNAPAGTLLEDDQLYVRIYVPETQIGRIKVGQEVPISVDSFDRTFKAKVEHINQRGEYSPRNLQTADERADQVFAVRVALIEGKDQLRAGMAATMRVAK